MRALCWHGKHDIRYDTVPDPTIEDGRDAIVKVSTCAICGSDLHLFDGFMPSMEHGDVMGHEFMGEVVEVGKDNRALKPGDRIVVPFTIICGECEQCRRGNFSVCERSNRNKAMADKVFGHATAGLFGYSHLTGGYAGGQAEYVRVPFADKTHVKVPQGLTDEQVLFLGDILPTGWQAVAQCDVAPTDTVAIPGVYGGVLDKIPFGAAMNKGLTFRMGQTHVNRWTGELLELIDTGRIDPSFVVTHTAPLEQGPGLYKTFRDKADGCIKVVLKP